MISPIKPLWENKNEIFNKYKDLKEEKDRLDSAIPNYELPPGHLWNIPNTDIWLTPNEPVEPGDCERWPQSCENILDPLNPNDARSLSPGFDFETSHSGCSVCVTVTPNLGAISFPSYTICRIIKECEEMMEPRQPPEPGLPIPPSIFLNLAPPIPDFPRNDTSQSQIYELKRYSTRRSATGNTPNPDQNFYENDRVTILLYPGEYIYGRYQRSADITDHTDSLYYRHIIETVALSIKDGSSNSRYLRAINNVGNITYIQDNYYHGWERYYVRKYQIDFYGNITDYEYDDIFYRKSEPIIFPSPDDNHGGGTSSPKIIPTPSPQPMPTCCDLESLKKMINKLSKQLDSLNKLVQPMSEVLDPKTVKESFLPKRFMYPLTEGHHKTPTYPSIFEALFRTIDRSFGATSYEVVIKDSDPNTPGDQALPIQIHSTNDGIKAILQHLIDKSSSKDSPAQTAAQNSLLNQKALTHIAFDLASTKKMIVENNHYLSNIEHYLDYEVKQKTVKVPFAINPQIGGYSDNMKNTTLIGRLFKTNEQKITVTDNIDKDGLAEILYKIADNSAAAAAPFKAKYSPGVLDKLVDIAQLGIEVGNAALLVDIKRSLGIMTKDEMKDWGNDAEKAYTISEGNEEVSRVPGQELKYYGDKKPARIKNTTKKSRKKNTNISGRGFG